MEKLVPARAEVGTSTGSWAETAPLSIARASFAAATLPDGTVLVAGGTGGGARSTERYDPATDIWSQAGNLAVSRTRHTLTVLDDGRVLAAGGRGPVGSLASAELFDPDGGTWIQTGQMATPRDSHVATKLTDGRVLVTGGVAGDEAPVTRSAEIFDPELGQWRTIDDLRVPRYHHAATLLADGRVLVSGGFSAGSFHTPLTHAEVYEPGRQRWSVITPLREARATHAAARLPDGSVLVAGGLVPPPNEPHATSSTEIWDPATERWRAGPSMTMPRRGLESLIPLDATRFLVVGGFDAGNQLTATTEVFDTGSFAWEAGAAMGAARAPALEKLADGRVLAIASLGRLLTKSVEVYTP